MKAALQKLRLKLRGWKVAILAAVLTGGEALVNVGIPLPYSDHIPAPLRGLLIAVLMGAAWYYRNKAEKERSGG